MKSPTVSIITVVFNGMSTLEDTIRSVLTQNYPRVEYVIVDGGSTDGTVDIIRKYEDRISKWVSEPDGGIADAMNRGIKMSSGDIIGIIHSDDYYEPGAISTVVAGFMENPDTGVIHGDIRFIAGDGRWQIVKPLARPKEVIWKHMPFRHPAVFVKREIYEKIGLFDISYKIAMDYDIMIRFLKQDVVFRYLERVFANMRAGGRSEQDIFETWRETEEIALRHGFNRTMVNGYYFFRRFERKTGNFLREHNLDGLAGFYRKIFYPSNEPD